MGTRVCGLRAMVLGSFGASNSFHSFQFQTNLKNTATIAGEVHIVHTFHTISCVSLHWCAQIRVCFERTVARPVSRFVLVSLHWERVVEWRDTVPLRPAGGNPQFHGTIYHPPPHASCSTCFLQSSTQPDQIRITCTPDGASNQCLAACRIQRR